MPGFKSTFATLDELRVVDVRAAMVPPNETKLSHCWRERASLRASVLKSSKVNCRASQRFAPALELGVLVSASAPPYRPARRDLLSTSRIFFSALTFSRR